MRLYRWLLRLLPGSFRARQLAALEDAAREQLAAAGDTPLSRLRVAVGLGADVVSTASSLRTQAVLSAVAQDARYAARLLRRAPGFAVVAALTLAIGIASNTTVFSLVNAFYLVPSEFPDSNRLMDVGETSPTKLCAGCGVGTSYPGYLDWRRRAQSFVSLEAYDEDAFVLSAPVTPERVSGARVTGGLFSVLGIAPVLGRDLTRGDDRPDAPPVMLLAYDLWQRLFAADREVIGRSVRVNGVPTQIVGVMPARFGFPERAHLWLPLSSAPPSTDRDDRRFGVVGRLRPGVTLDAARAEMRTIGGSLAAEYPASQADWSIDVKRVGEDRVGAEGQAFLVMLGAVALVLAVACANLAALFLARATQRSREFAVRAALGADRGRLVRQLVVETLVIGAIGGVLGLMLALQGVDLARRGIAVPEVPYYVNFAVDWRVLVFGAAATIGASLLVGLVPALGATRRSLVDSLKQGSGSGLVTSPSQRRIRSSLVAGELALVLMLLSGAAVMGRSFLRFAERPGGYDLDGLTLAQLPLAGSRFEKREALGAALADLTQRVEAIPGAQVALSHTEFVAGFGRENRSIRIEGTVTPAGASPRFAFAITPGYFATQGLRVKSGRAFTAADRAGSEPVAIVSQQMADAIRPALDPIGARIQLRPDRPGDPWRVIVGIVSNYEGDPAPGRRVNPYVYIPLAQSAGRPIDVMVRTTGASAAAIAGIRTAVSAIDPDQPLTNIRSAVEEHRRGYWFVGYFAVFYVTFAAFALVLAVIGVYGVVSQTVGERAREFGIRAALGADRRRLYRLVLGRSLMLAAIGGALGLAGSAFGTRLLGWLLFGANPNDPRTLGAALATLVLTVLVASYLPARRAARIDPVIVLRQE
ncbi:MAG: ABC transporter permease [Acidobacteriota bacterium]